MHRVFAFELISTLLLIGSIRTHYGWGESGIAATVAPFLLTTTPHQATLGNLGQGAVNNLLAIPAPAGERTETRQKHEAAFSFPPSELLNQNENSRTNRIASSEGTTARRTASSKMPETIAIRYVSHGGSDANDGLSWVSAKHTIYGALVSLPGGDATMAGSGTIYVGPNSAANPTANAGLWLMGTADPNYDSPPAGWLKCNGCVVSIIGLGNTGGGPNAHRSRVLGNAWGSGTDNNHPGIWLSSTQSPIYIANFAIQYPGRGIVIGECSNNKRTGTCGVSGVTLENNTAGLSGTGSAGPCTDITGGSFWIFMRDEGCSGNAYNATGGYRADNGAAVLIDGRTNSGNGLIYINDANFAGGGIKVYPGSNGVSLYVKNVTEEGDFVHSLPPVVWFTSYNFADSTLESLNLADSTGTNVVLENDGAAPGPSIIGSAQGVIVGPAVILEQWNNSFVNSIVSPLRYGQTGFFNGYVVGETDVARRISGLVPNRFPNKASSNPAQWFLSNYSGANKLTPGAADPFGGTGAATATSTDSQNENLFLTSGGGCSVSYTPAPGDWIVMGVWEKNKAVGGSITLATCGYPSPTFSSSRIQGNQLLGDGQWAWVWSAYKISGGSATYLGPTVQFNSANPTTVYGPVLYIIPTGTLSDNEVLEFASTTNSVDSSCEGGQICNMSGHPVVVSSYGTLSNCSSASSPAKCDSAPAGSFVLGVGSTTAKVNTTAVTAKSQILIIEDSSLGARLGVSCNKTAGRTYMITDRSPGISFTISSSFAPTDHPACLSFQVLN